jgi:hypothetical protein
MYVQCSLAVLNVALQSVSALSISVPRLGQDICVVQFTFVCKYLNVSNADCSGLWLIASAFIGFNVIMTFETHFPFIEELLGRKSSGCGLQNREYGRSDPSR